MTAGEKPSQANDDNCVIPAIGVHPTPSALSLVILNLFQDHEPRLHVILKQVQDDEAAGNNGESCLIPQTAKPH
jgi:hypothetical protein